MGPWVGSAPGRGGEGPNGVEHLKQWRAAAALLCTTLLRLAVQADGGPVHRVQKGCDSVADGAVADTGHPAQVAQAHLILTKLCHPHHIPHVLRRHTLYSHVSPLSFVCPPAGSCAENGGKVFLFDPNKTLWTPGVDIQSVLRAPVDVQSVLSLSSSGPAVLPLCLCIPAGSCAENGGKVFFFNPDKTPVDDKSNRMWFHNYTTEEEGVVAGNGANDGLIRTVTKGNKEAVKSVVLVETKTQSESTV